MQLITDIGTLVLTAYLALTNGLAAFILPPQDSSIRVSETIVSPLKQIESTYELIPDVLLKNAAFQQANVTGSITEGVRERFSVETALVNIFCTYRTDEVLNTTTGSGFFISPTGAILTNAHVAQFLLLEQSRREGETDCVIRTGSPATTQYEAKLLYIPPTWITEHADLITAEVPKGTGERDYALLYASASLTDTPMPARFPYLQPDQMVFSYNQLEDPVTVAGYPAQPLFTGGAQANLDIVSATTILTDLFTFGGETADLISIGETPVSASGSSGGPILNEAGDVIAVITTKGETGSDSLRGLTMDYVNRTILEETGFGLSEYVQGDLSVRATVFNDALAPFLLRLLEFELGV